MDKTSYAPRGRTDNIWNNRHLAICYRLNRNYQVAITYYKKVEEASPEDTNVTFHIGVKSISGSFYNIMGLPIQKLYGELKKL